MKRYIVKAQSRGWGIYDLFMDGILVEGGFFSRLAADAECREYNARWLADYR